MVRLQNGQQIVTNYAYHLGLATGHALMTMIVGHGLLTQNKCFKVFHMLIMVIN